MDTDGLAALAQSTTREGFVAKVPSRFLVLENELNEQEVAFSTRVLDAAAARRALQKGGAANVEVLPVVKAPTNPYPDRVSVGRARNCDVVMRDPSISKLHAHFRLGGDKLELVDAASQNGTRVNGRPLTPHQPQLVEPGDVLWFGTVSCKLVDASALYDLLR